MYNDFFKYGKTRLLSLRLDCPFISTELLLIEVTNMDLFWSGLARRASEHTWSERRSQFDKVFETAVRDIETQESENQIQ
jgi:hypothetical protein